MTKRGFEKFARLEIVDVALLLLVYDADRGADIRRHDLGTDDARTLIDAGIAKGERHAISTDVEEIAASRKAWIALEAARHASVTVHLDPDKAARERRLAELARLFAGDDEPLH